MRKVVQSSKGHSQTPSTVDGFVSDTDISHCFATKLQSLLNSDTDLNSRSALLASINTSITSNDLASIIISPKVVSEALGQTKSGKADGTNLVLTTFSMLPLHWQFSYLISSPPYLDTVTYRHRSETVYYNQFLNLGRIQAIPIVIDQLPWPLLLARC